MKVENLKHPFHIVANCGQIFNNFFNGDFPKNREFGIEKFFKFFFSQNGKISPQKKPLSEGRCLMGLSIEI